MRLEPGWAIKTLEHYLYNYYDEVRKLHEMKEEIIMSSPAQFQEVGGGGISRHSDPTALKGIKLTTNAEIVRREKWLRVVRDLVEDMKIIDKREGKNYTGLIQKKYFDELGEDQICDELHIEHTTYHQWKKDILRHGLLLATALGLIKYEELRKVS
ncbi:DUF1492 domain-containing protein [Caldanaerobius polysaccharolyticus]|uniref:DUF1492 domain-containing protein n=1 Tax=Caldanaerobius polysaccharolyticus TaxID=44256 RepID=UPI00047B4506|nr:DUF1492 domain-containing protein [Caldanaerobius polysaccharolyticus]